MAYRTITESKEPTHVTYTHVFNLLKNEFAKSSANGAQWPWSLQSWGGQAGMRVPGMRMNLPGYDQPTHEHSPFDVPVSLSLLLEVVSLLCGFYCICSQKGNGIGRALFRSHRWGFTFGIFPYESSVDN